MSIRACNNSFAMGCIKADCDSMCAGNFSFNSTSTFHGRTCHYRNVVIFSVFYNLPFYLRKFTTLTTSLKAVHVQLKSST